MIKTATKRLFDNGVSTKRLLIILTLEIIISIISALYPTFIGKIITIITNGDNKSFDLILYYSYIFIISLIIWLGLSFFARKTIKINEELVLSTLRTRLLRSFFNMPKAIKNINGTGYYNQRIIDDSLSIQNYFYSLWVSLASLFITILFIFCVMLYINPALTLVSVAILPLLALFAKKMTKYIETYNIEFKESYARINEYYQECINNDKSILVFFRLEYVQNKIRILVDKFIYSMLKVFKLSFLSLSISSTLGNYLTGLLVLLVGSYLVLNKRIDAGMLIAFYFYPNLLWSNIQELVDNYFTYTQYNAIWKRIDEILIWEKENVYQDITYKSLESLRLKDLCFEYNKNNIVFNSFSFDFLPNSLYVINGESGKGKSTLISLISCMVKPTSGSILLNNQPLIGIPSKNSTIKIGMLYQDTDIFKESLKYNVIFDNQFDKNKFDYVINSVGLHTWVQELPAKENTILSESGNNISFGQKQRIGIARLLYADDSIWLLDEPTASLDLTNESEIIKIISNCKQDRIIICVSHRPAILDYADNVITI